MESFSPSFGDTKAIYVLQCSCKVTCHHKQHQEQRNTVVSHSCFPLASAPQNTFSRPCPALSVGQKAKTSHQNVCRSSISPSQANSLDSPRCRCVDGSSAEARAEPPHVLCAPHRRRITRRTQLTRDSQCSPVPTQVLAQACARRAGALPINTYYRFCHRRCWHPRFARKRLASLRSRRRHPVR